MRLISGDQFKNNMLNKVPLTYVAGDPFEPLHKPRFLAFALNCLPISEPSSLLIHAELYFIKKISQDTSVSSIPGRSADMRSHVAPGRDRFFHQKEIQHSPVCSKRLPS